MVDLWTDLVLSRADQAMEVDGFIESWLDGAEETECLVLGCELGYSVELGLVLG